MLNKIRNSIQNKKILAALVFFIILAQLIFISCTFAFAKDGYHVDELYSYGLSNSYRSPFLADDENESQYVNKWIDGSVLNDYLTVGEDEAFDYENVWYNQALDRHPILYYSILHTICSFFPGQFSRWFGFSINIAVFVVTQIFLFLLSKKLFKSNWLAVFVILCYGFCLGALNTFIYIRMYAMATMWVVILAYLHAKLLDPQGVLKPKNLIPITVVVVLGVLTNHTFTIMAFVFAVCFCLRYLAKKQVKNFFLYGCSMLLGVLLAWAVFTPLMSQIFAESESTGLSLSLILEQYLVTWRYIFKSLFGISPMTPGEWTFFLMMAPVVILLIVVFALPICFLLRKNEGFLKLVKKVKTAFINLGKKIKSICQSIYPRSILEFFARIKNINFMFIVLFLSSQVVMVIAARTTNFAVMGCCDRYIFIVYPFMLLVFVAAVYCIIGKIRIKRVQKHSKAIVCVLFALLSLQSIIRYDSDYLFEGASDIGDLTEITADSTCIVVGYDIRAVTIFAPYFRYADNVFATSYGTLCDETEEITAEIDSLETDGAVYLFVCGETDSDAEEVLDTYFSSLSFYSQPDCLGTVTIFNGSYVVYRMSQT